MSTKRSAVLSLATCLLAGAACRTPQITLPSTEDSAQLYRDMCGACHGLDGTGNGPAAAALKTTPTDLTLLTQRHGGLFPREMVLQVMTGERRVAAHGSRTMPVWSQRFAPTGTGAATAAALYARRRLDLILHHLETMQRDGVP